MHLIRVLRSSTFRYAIIYMLVFGVSVAGVMGFVYWQTVRVIAAQTDDTIQAEITGLAEQYRQFGLVGLMRIIRERSQAAPGRRGLYLLADRNYNRIEGNLSSWPPIARGASEARSISWSRPMPAATPSPRWRAPAPSPWPAASTCWSGAT